MSTNQKGSASQAKLPISTEFAAWWLGIFGTCLTIGAVVFLVFSSTCSPGAALCGHHRIVPYILLFIGGILTIISAISVFKKNNHEWKFALTAMLFFETAYALELHDKPDAFPKTLQVDPYTLPLILIIGVVAYLLPILLIIRDRQNYSKAIRKQELEKSIVVKEKPGDNHKLHRHHRPK